MMISDDSEALKAVKQNGYSLQFIIKQTKEICSAAVKQDGYALRFVNEQTYEICLAAVKQNKHALQHVRALEIFKRIANELDIDIEI